MESKEIQRSRKINRIFEMATRSGGVAFHKIKTLEGKDITFTDNSGTLDIFVEKFDHIGKVEESLEVEWDYLSDEVLNEIVEIINESNQGITH
jgi:hypothetical protein